MIRHPFRPRRVLAVSAAFAALTLAALLSVDAGRPTAAAAQKGDKKPAAHWAFQPVRPVAVPQVKNAAWVRNPIDAFIAAEHAARGLTPSAEADRRTLLRRVTLDLIGLPPTPEEIDAFLKDAGPNAYEKVV